MLSKTYGRGRQPRASPAGADPGRIRPGAGAPGYGPSTSGDLKGRQPLAWRTRHGSNLGNTRVYPVSSQGIDTLALASQASLWRCYLGPTSQMLYMCFDIRYWQLSCCSRTRTASGANTREPCREVAYGSAISRRRASASCCVASSPLDPNSVANSLQPVQGIAVACKAAETVPLSGMVHLRSISGNNSCGGTFSTCRKCSAR